MPTLGLRLTGLTALLIAQGCASSPATHTSNQPTQADNTASGQASPTSPVSNTPATVPSGMRRVQGQGWSLAIPSDWNEHQVGEHSEAGWQGSAPDDEQSHFSVSVSRIGADETLDQMAGNFPNAYQQRGGTAHVRHANHGGHPALDLEVSFAGETREIPMFLSVAVEGRRGAVVSCGGDPGADLEATCRGVLASLWLGANENAQPTATPARGMRWFGGRGRYVQAPSAWNRPVNNTDAGAQTAMGVGDEGDHHAVVIDFIDDVQVQPAEAVQLGVQALQRDHDATISSTRPFHTGRRFGALVDMTRRLTTTAPTRLFQRLLQGPPDHHLLVSCASAETAVAAHPDFCTTIFDTFVIEGH